MNNNSKENNSFLSPSDDIELTIDDLSSMGSGVGRHNGKAIFVPFTTPGDVITARIVKNKKNFANARLISIDRPGNSRITPQCKYFTLCGGCDYQHITYDAEVQLKEMQLKQIFKRNAGIEIDTAMLLPSLRGHEYGYRNRARFQIDEQGRLGFMASGSNKIIAIDECPVCVSSINSCFEHMYDTLEDGQLSVFGFADTVYQENLSVKILEKIIHFNAKGFFQSNVSLLEKLIKQLNSWWSTDSTQSTAWDLYGGVGLFALFMQDYFESVVSVESYTPAHAYALKNGVQQHRSQKVEAFLKKADTAPDVCFVDPPRAGLSDTVVSQLIRLKPENITYLSCDPATQARDIGILCRKAGYKIRNVQLVDFYPRTRHMEGLAVLSRS